MSLWRLILLKADRLIILTLLKALLFRELNKDCYLEFYSIKKTSVDKMEVTGILGEDDDIILGAIKLRKWILCRI